MRNYFFPDDYCAYGLRYLLNGKQTNMFCIYYSAIRYAVLASVVVF